MILDLAEIKQRTQPLLIETDFGPDEFEFPTELRLQSPVHCRVRVAALGQKIRVTGKLEADLEITCSRCLSGFAEQIAKSFDLFYEPDLELAGEGEEFALSYGDLEIGFYHDERLDLRAIVGEQVLLDVPMKPVCQKGCLGLCDQCGQDLNTGRCHCTKEKTDPRLEPLKALMKRMNE